MLPQVAMSDALGVRINRDGLDFLEAEIEGLYNTYPIMFDGAEHVRLYTEPQYKERYGKKVNDFLRMD